MDKKSNYDQFLGTFIDRLIEEKNLSQGETAEVAVQIKADLMEMLDRKIDSLILANLPDDKLEDFDKILDTEDSGQIKQFITTNIPDFDEVLSAGLLEFRQAYI